MAMHFGLKKQRVLVTGATGFIGSLLVYELLKDGHQVTVLTRSPEKVAHIFGNKVHSVQSLDQLPTNFSIDTIINLAGARILGWRWTSARQTVLRRSRIDLTNTLVNWISKAEHKPALLLSASAIGFYGIQAHGDNTELTEDSPTQNIFMARLCHDWELAAQSASQYGTKVVRLRFGLVLGREGALPMMALPIKLGMGGPLGSGNQWMSWIHVDDLIGAIAHLCSIAENRKAAINDVYNFTAPESLQQIDFSKTAAEILHRPCFFPTPSWPMRLALGEQADLLLEGQRVRPANLVASGFEFQYPDADSALRNLLQ